MEIIPYNTRTVMAMASQMVLKKYTAPMFLIKIQMGMGFLIMTRL